MVVLGGNQADAIIFEHPDPLSKGVEYFVPIAYQKFAEKEQNNELQEINTQALRLAMGAAVPKSLKSTKLV